MTKIKPFRNKYNWKGINVPSVKIIKQLVLVFCMLKRKKYIMLMFQQIT